MRFIAFALVLIFAAMLHAAEGTRISEANKEHSGCDLEITGIESKSEFLKFFSDLKEAARTPDKTKFGRLVIFPLRVNFNPKSRKVKSNEELIKDFDRIFTTKVIAAIKAQEVKNIFCRDQGVMIGVGDVWIQQDGKQIGISTVNP